MIVKPSIAFVTLDSDAQLVIDTENILVATAANVAIYATPTPTLVAVKAALDKFTAAIAAAADGGTALTSAKNDARAALGLLLRNLASYVQVACGNDVTKLLLSGYAPQKTQRTPVGILPAPASVTLTLGVLSGTLDAAVPPVYGAAIYNWELSSAAPGVATVKLQTTAASTTFTGLMPGLVYAVKANVVGAAGPSDWSVSSSQMAV